MGRGGWLDSQCLGLADFFACQMSEKPVCAGVGVERRPCGAFASGRDARGDHRAAPREYERRALFGNNADTLSLSLLHPHLHSLP